MNRLLLLITAIVALSCAKKENKPANQQNNPLMAESSVGEIITSKWIFTEGDTVFNDTLVLTLKSVSLNKKSKSEVLTFSFNYPVWHTNSLACSREDYNGLTQLLFNNESCMTARFVLAKK
ncbi:MAG: hypothetical protein IT247_02260 [Bacteroidia bacterium]|nr:hypothetical protein [Bacteroidia bacterium]